MRLCLPGIQCQVVLTGSNFVSVEISRDADRLINAIFIVRTDSAQVLGMYFIKGVRTKELLESTVSDLAPKSVSHAVSARIFL